MYMYVCMYVCIYVYMYMYVCMCVYIYIYIYISPEDHSLIQKMGLNVKIFTIFMKIGLFYPKIVLF